MTLRKISSSKILLIAILSLFVVKGVIFDVLIPAFQNPDEPVHFATIQHWAEPEGLVRAPADTDFRVDAEDISTYRLTEEIIRSAVAVQFDGVKFQRQNIQSFSENGLLGPSEALVTDNQWRRSVEFEQNNVSGTTSLYYLAGSWVERWLSDFSVLVRLHAIRFLSVLFGFGIVLLSYLTARKIGFSEKISLLLTTLVAFQPMLAVTAAQINIDIALVFSFSLFLYAGVSFLQGADSSTSLGMTKWAALAMLAAGIGLFSKGPGIVLVVALYPLFAWGIYARMTGGEIPRQARNDKRNKFFVYLAATTIVIAGLIFLVAPKEYLAGITNASAQSRFDSPLESVGKYLSKTMDMGEFRESSVSYWGNFGWLDTPIPRWILSVINWIESIGFVAMLAYLLAPVLKKMDWIAAVAALPRNDKVGWLPERKYLVFFLGMILALQFAIRFYDWRIFDATKQLLIGTPGRYFLPNLVGHLVLVVVGVGLAVSWVKERMSKIPAFAGMTDGEKTFEMILKILALGMILLQMYAIVNVIIPRYYL